MPDWTLVNRSHVMAALTEHDRLGSREFLSRYRFGRSAAYTLWHGGQEYDAKAVLGVAYLHATGTTATRDELNASESAGVRLLQGFGFDVVVDEEALEQEERRRAARPATVVAAPRATRTAGTTGAAPRAAPAARKPAAARSARVKPADAVVKVCATCHMAVPATGVCDFCE